MIEECGNRLIAQISQTQQHGVITQACRKFRLFMCLFLFAANACDFHYLVAVHFAAGEFQYWSQQRELRIANRELGCMNADCDSARPGGQVITSECALAPFIQFALGGQSQRVCRNHQAREQLFPYVHQNFPSLA